MTIAVQNAYAHIINIFNNVLAVGGQPGLSAGHLVANTINLSSSELLIGGPTVGDFEASGHVAVSDHIQLQTADSSVVFNANNSFVFTPFLRGQGSVAKDGPGVVTLASGVSDNYSGSTTINGGALLVETSTGSLGSGGTTINSGATLQLQNAGQYNIAVTLSGNGFDGDGAVQSLAGTNEFGVADDILGADASVGAHAGSHFIFDSAIQLAGHTLTLEGGGEFTVDDIFASAGGVAINGATTVTFNDDDLYTGATNIINGLLKLNSTNIFEGGSGSAFTVSASGVLEVDADNAIGSLTGAGKVTLEVTTLTVGSNNLSTTFSGVIQDGTGHGGFAKIGSGLLVLTSANTYSGSTNIEAGQLEVRNDDALGADSGDTFVQGGASLLLDGYSNSSKTASLNGLGFGGGGALRSVAGDNTFGGAIDLASSASIKVAAGSLTLGAISGSGSSLQIGGAGLIEVLSDVNLGSGGLTKIGSDTLELFGAGLYTGATSITAGAVTDFSDDAISDAAALSISAGATFQIDGDEAVGSLSGAGGVSTFGDNSTFSVLGSVSSTFSGSISNGFGVGSLTKAGAGVLTLSGASSFDGATNINGGALLVENGQALGSTAGGTTVASGASLQLEGGVTVGAEALTLNGSGLGGALRSLSGFNAYNGAITLGSATLIDDDSGLLILTGKITGPGAALTVDSVDSTVINGAIATTTGSLTKTGAGGLSLAGVSTYSGATTIKAGVLTIVNSGSLANSAVSIAADAKLDISTTTTGTTIGGLSGAGSTSTVTLGGKSLIVNKVSSATAVTYVGAASAASHLTINAASTNFDLSTASFSTWTNTGNSIKIVGNSVANTLTGSSQSDSLFGGAGDDTLIGGAGTDYLDGGAGADKLNGTGGTSFADYEDATAGVTINLLTPSLNAGDAKGDTYVNIHRVLGSGLDDKITGDNAGDVLHGGAGVDTMTGGSGSDVLYGGTGSDVMTGGGGADQFSYLAAAEGGDIITDFSAAQGDVISVYHAGAGFGGGGLPSSGVLPSSHFVNGTAATAATGQFLWNSATSTLSWDIDGTGSKAAVVIATLTGVKTFLANNIDLF